VELERPFVEPAAIAAKTKNAVLATKRHDGFAL
jgi:hypothetical protein